MLRSINFEWNAQEAAWDRHMKNLHSFRKEYGHVHVPLNHPDYPKLGLWAKEQRRHYALMQSGKPTHMTLERSKNLESVGFIWDTQEATWMGRLVQLKRFKERYGDCNVPDNWAEDPTLFQWVSHQRKQHKKFQSGKSRQMDSNESVYWKRLVSRGYQESFNANVGIFFLLGASVFLVWHLVHGKSDRHSDRLLDANLDLYIHLVMHSSILCFLECRSHE